MKSRIGILTFHDALNYGAVLQSYALQKYISTRHQVCVEIINYKPSGREAFHITKYKGSNRIKQLIGDSINLIYRNDLTLRRNRFLEFANNYQHLSQKKYERIADFTDISSAYDILISGSDQVFNPKSDSNIYYLGFEADCVRLAYAPSIGLTNIDYKTAERITPWLEQFDSLSCREEQGAVILGSLSGKNVPVVCDPVFLLTKEEWGKVAVNPNISNYIFVFDLNGGKELFLLAQKVKKHTGLPIVYSSLKTIHPYTGLRKVRHELGPREWLGYIMNASYVVTDSFHGSMFSLIFDVPLINKIAVKQTRSRLISIMQKLHIDKQIINDINSFDMSDIKFNYYRKPLQDFINTSKAYLDNAISRFSK